MRKTGFLILLLNCQNKACLYWDYAKHDLFLLSDPNEKGIGKDLTPKCVGPGPLCLVLSGGYNLGKYPLCRVWRKLGFVRGMDLGINIKSITFKTLDDLKRSLTEITTECASISPAQLRRQVKRLMDSVASLDSKKDENPTEVKKQHQENVRRAKDILHLPN